MPPLSLTGRRQSVLAHMLAPFSPAALESLVDEDFLLVHGCTDIGRRTKKRRINPTTGICYSTTYSDLHMEYRITAEALGLFGLANYHPGQRLDRASSPVLPFLNGVEAFGITGGTLIYEDPVRTRIPGDFPGISFTVVRENASYSGATIPPVTVDSVTTTSGTGGNPAGSRYAAIYGVSTIWTRRLNLIGPVTGLTYFNNALLWFTLPKTTSAPSTIAAFLQDVDHAPEVSGINVDAIGIGGVARCVCAHETTHAHVTLRGTDKHTLSDSRMHAVQARRIHCAHAQAPQYHTTHGRLCAPAMDGAAVDAAACVSGAHLSDRITQRRAHTPRLARRLRLDLVPAPPVTHVPVTHVMRHLLSRAPSLAPPPAPAAGAGTRDVMASRSPARDTRTGTPLARPHEHVTQRARRQQRSAPACPDSGDRAHARAMAAHTPPPPSAPRAAVHRSALTALSHTRTRM